MGDTALLGDEENTPRFAFSMLTTDQVQRATHERAVGFATGCARRAALLDSADFRALLVPSVGRVRKGADHFSRG
jgi:hypothetical protein